MLISLSTLFSIGKLEYFYKNLIFWTIAFLIIFLSPFVKFEYLVKSNLFYFFYFLSILALILILIIPSKNRSWIEIGGFSFQPSEFTRIFFLIALSLFLSKYYHLLNNNFYLLLSFLIVSPFFILIMLQPDLGMFLVYFLTWMISVGIFLKPFKILKISILILILAIFAWFFVLKDYQKERILTFINPYKDPLKSGYNIIQIRIALGSAGFWGKGYGQGTQAKLGFLPASHTDFILVSFIEERGFIGLVLYVFLFLWFLYILNYEKSLVSDPIAQVFTNLLIIHFAIKFLLTVSVNLSLFPIIGLAVPFLSYGGSHLISDSILIAIWHSLRYK